MRRREFITLVVLSGEEKKAWAASCDDYVPNPSVHDNCWRKWDFSSLRAAPRAIRTRRHRRFLFTKFAAPADRWRSAGGAMGSNRPIAGAAAPADLHPLTYSL
jgi:hypothetical protein